MSPRGVSPDDAFTELIKLSTRKANQINNFPVKILKQSADIFTANMCNFFSFCVNEDKFQNIFTHANITFALKKVAEGPRRAIVL